MKLTDDIRVERDVLANKVSTLVNEFITKNGDCELDINIDYTYESTPTKGKILTSTLLEIKVEIV